jgi:hypothetical protein
VVKTDGLMTQGGDLDGAFTQGDELLTRIASSKTVRDCFAQEYMLFALLRTALTPEDQCSLDKLTPTFHDSGDLKGLVIAIASSDSFRNRSSEGDAQ